jgi:murein L,D-transpeptidase YcbB/YkuD
MLAAGLAFSVAMPSSAGAVTLLDLLRGGPGKQGAREQQALPGVVTGNGSSARVTNDADPEPLPRIAGPRYYTYKADATQTVKTTGFGQADNEARFLDNAKVSAPVDVAKALEAYYGAGGKTLWVTNGEVNEKANAVLEFFAGVSASGLDPADYIISVPASDVTASISETPATAPEEPVQQQVSSTNDAYQRALMQFELSLSAKVLTYVQDNMRGRIDPNKLSGYHDFKRKTVNLAPVLKLSRLSTDITAYLRSREPSNPEYLSLKAELAALREQDGNEHERIVLSDTLLLKPGNTNAELASVVKAIQHRSSETLKQQHSETFTTYQQTPEYTPELVELVKAFQGEHGLKADGVIGRATVRAMIGDSNEAKINKVVVAMEQVRWLPADLGQRYVFINQPAFMAYYHNEGKEEFGMKVVVGSKANQTYFFQDQIQTVEFNPYWGVPQSIIVNEMLPKLRNDPSYLDRLGYQVEVGGKPVSSSSVNWYGSTNAIAVRQPPSSDNALGDLKILFPNAHAIYMHDTPAKSFFSRDMRALSHGCIRLVDPRRMAAAVMGVGISEIDQQIASGKNRAVQVPVKIPVYVSYFTAWPNKDGKVEFFDDVYDRDSYVMKAFGVTSKARGSSV